MSSITRREFTGQSLTALLTWSFLHVVAQKQAFADKVRLPALKWLNDINQLGWDLKGEKLSQQDWQKKIEALHAQVDVDDFLKVLDFEKLMKNLEYVDHGARSLSVKFPKIEGIPEKFAFGQQIFALKKERAVVPHGHNNMATAFLILKGEFHGRHYDRLEDEEEHILIKPTIDRTFKTGEVSSISDYKDNIHWFLAKSETAFIYNIHVDGVRPGSKVPTGRVYLDPDGEKLADGRIRAKRLEYEDVNKLYGGG
jgi:hypothetical protein